MFTLFWMVDLGQLNRPFSSPTGRFCSEFAVSIGLLIIARSPEIDLCLTCLGLIVALVRDRSPQTVSGPLCEPPNLCGACLGEWKLSQVRQAGVECRCEEIRGRITRYCLAFDLRCCRKESTRTPADDLWICEHRCTFFERNGDRLAAGKGVEKTC